jgi:hypothetical protein
MTFQMDLRPIGTVWQILQGPEYDNFKNFCKYAHRAETFIQEKYS